MERSLTDEEINDLQVTFCNNNRCLKSYTVSSGTENCKLCVYCDAVESAGASGDQVKSCSQMSILFCLRYLYMHLLQLGLTEPAIQYTSYIVQGNKFHVTFVLTSNFATHCSIQQECVMTLVIEVCCFGVLTFQPLSQQHNHLASDVVQHNFGKIPSHGYKFYFHSRASTNSSQQNQTELISNAKQACLLHPRRTKK